MHLPCYAFDLDVNFSVFPAGGSGFWSCENGQLGLGSYVCFCCRPVLLGGKLFIQATELTTAIEAEIKEALVLKTLAGIPLYPWLSIGG